MLYSATQKGRSFAQTLPHSSVLRKGLGTGLECIDMILWLSVLRCIDILIYCCRSTLHSCTYVELHVSLTSVSFL